MSQTLASYTVMVQNEVEDTSTRAKSIIERAIKDTYQEIIGLNLEALAGITEEDITATAGQRYVTPTNTFQDFKRVLYATATDTNYVPLGIITEEEYYDHFVNLDSSTPRNYYLKVNDIYFDLAPNDAGTVKVAGTVVQDELSGATVSIIPDRFTQVLVKGAVAHFKAYEGLQDAREYFRVYRGPYFEQGKIGGALKEMMNQLETRTQPKRPNLMGR
jgi:hypothetical protein